MFNAWPYLPPPRLPPLSQDAACTNTLSVTGTSTTWQRPEVKDGTPTSRAARSQRTSSELILEVEQDRENRPPGVDT